MFWIPFLWQEHYPLLILGFWIFSNSTLGLRNKCLNTDQQFPQNLEKSSDGCSLLRAITQVPEVLLTWVLFLLLIWGFWVFETLHSRSKICIFENVVRKYVIIPQFLCFLTVTLFEQLNCFLFPDVFMLILMVNTSKITRDKLMEMASFGGAGPITGSLITPSRQWQWWLGRRHLESTEH